VMSLFFDADWFDARLAAKALDRNALAASAGLERAELHRLFINERAATADEMAAFAALLEVDQVEIALRCGVANRDARASGDSGARIDGIEARLDEIETWLNALEAGRKRA